MQSSHTAAECFESCKRKYKMRYVDKLKTLPPDNADNALILGTALHTGIEKSVEAAIQEYYFSYPVITDAHVTEAMKLEIQIPKARAVVPKGQHEVLVSTSRFKGFIDLLVPVGAGVYDLWDFKYSNHVDRYMESRQLHLYKYYFEKAYPGRKIRKMYFLFVPKNSSKQKKDESLFAFRQRIIEELKQTEVQAVEVQFNYEKVIEHLEIVQDIQQETEYEADEGWLCRYCDYEEYCLKGRNYMILPSAERRNISQTKKRKIWIYGAAFSGKTTMLDEAPNPLNLNTDGNIEFVTMPYVTIKDEVTVEGRITKRKYAWEVFKETIGELEKKQNDFQTIIVDLLEDTREACRVYMYKELGIQHESDSSYGKGWDIIKTEYLSTIRRLFNLDYENIVVVSHEDVSKDITKKNGQNITRISPNIQDAVANKVAGMVDIVARVVVEDDGTRTLNFKSNEVIFGGGRLKGIQQTTIPLKWSELMRVYEDANSGKSQATPAPVQTEEPKKRGRKSKTAESEPEAEQPGLEDTAQASMSPEDVSSADGMTIAKSMNCPSAENVCDEDTYFYIAAADNYIMKHSGEPYPEGGTVITKDEFNQGVKRIAGEAAPAEPVKRTRRSRKSAN